MLTFIHAGAGITHFIEPVQNMLHIIAHVLCVATLNLWKTECDSAVNTVWCLHEQMTERWIHRQSVSLHFSLLSVWKKSTET